MANVVTAYAELSGRGERHTIEDTSVIVPNFRGNPAEFVAAVYDGHHGRSAADIAAEVLHGELEQALAQSASPGAAMTQAFLATDRIIADREKESAKSYSGADFGGAVAVVAYIHEFTLVVGNAGDAHAVLDRSGRAERLTYAHRASDPPEARRIRHAGGKITRRQDDLARVKGQLAVTRALGDTRLKELIIAEPSVREVALQPGDERLILGCDGLWDYVDDQDAVDLLRQRRITDATEASKTLMKEALWRGSKDDITVIVVSLDLSHSRGPEG
ncbi:MAG: PP2C family protein-serine/threonine phosphatase [Anaerolineae bacterium]|jgi:serine/threonine protein phosphatase PrpC